MQNQILLLEDVYNLGRKGDIVKAKPGYIRNYILPKKKGVVATPYTLRMREKLQQDRERQAVIDRADSESLAKVIEGKVLSTIVKVDPAGHMYGSVSANDIVKLFDEQGVTVERVNIALVHPIKETGSHKIEVRLKEGVQTYFHLNIVPEGGKIAAEPATVNVEEIPPQEQGV